MSSIKLYFCKITEERVVHVILKSYIMIYCMLRNLIPEKHFYKYYVFLFPHLIKRKVILILIWRSVLKKFKIENRWWKCSYGEFPDRIFNCLEHIFILPETALLSLFFSCFRQTRSSQTMFLKCLNQVVVTRKGQWSHGFNLSLLQSTSFTYLSHSSASLFI